jgi:hypothetical protein
LYGTAKNIIAEAHMNVFDITAKNENSVIIPPDEDDGEQLIEFNYTLKLDDENF